MGTCLLTQIHLSNLVLKLDKMHERILVSNLFHKLTEVGNTTTLATLKNYFLRIDWYFSKQKKTKYEPDPIFHISLFVTHCYSLLIQ